MKEQSGVAAASFGSSPLALDDVFRVAFEHSAAGVAVAAPDGSYLHANAAFCELVGYGVTELRRMNMMDLTHRDDEHRARELWQRMQRGAASEAPWECRFVHRSGATVWGLLTTTLVRTGDGEPEHVVSQVIDVGDRRIAEESLQRAEARFRAMIAAMQDVIVVLDGDGTYVDIAPSAMNRLVRPAAELLHRRLHDVLPQERADEFLGQVRRALESGESVEHEYDLVIAGERYWFESTITPVPDNRVVWVARDVTARRRAEEALRESEDQLRQAQKMEAIGQLAGGIAHDFNNLLMAIMSNAELASLELPPSSSAAQNIEEIRAASRRARSLTQQLLAFSRKQMLQPRVLDINAVIREALEMLRRLIGEHIAMTVDLEPALGHVRADPGQLVQVVMNLVVNARDAMRDGGVLAIETGNRDVSEPDARLHRGLRPGRYVTLRVRDSGIGMDERTKAHIFEPFFTTKPPGEGTGLGLSTAYGIIKQSEGYIAVDTGPGAGSTFTIFLPRVSPEESPGNGAAAGTPPAVSKGTVLLVEDEIAVREATKRMLRRFGYTVLEARHGEDALLVWREAAQRVDVVITDVVMPVMGGAQLVQRLRESRPRVRVIFMSGYTQGTLELSPDDDLHTRFLPKPFTSEQLLRAMAELVGAR